ncbi:AAA family ATPase [Actinospica sp. MGRD01-02]|uniref:AAA family ATPase n=1 Tax=Actinospica acidithermotolerans TaxID=2828514 RepID=A0A941EEN5_9ACTN|nr:YhaN family protein [Actinospica acidithermotolerans]MBR7829298.1 AAA family ATPase [Actinospica acidithermotolerans]
MRIDRFDLDRYGRFSGTSLDLSGPGVHLVVGPNEAGKSTLRNAIADLLYGIKLHTPYAFVHDMPSLRLAALLRASDGGVQEIVRLKRNKAALRGPGDEILEQVVLDRILVGVSRDDFTRTFAIDHNELRAGGKRLLDVNGEVGQALFESQSSAHLSSLHKELAEQIRKLWVSGGKLPVLNAALHDAGPYRTALRRRDEALLSPRHYQQAQSAVAEAEKRRAQIAEQLTHTRQERERLMRIQQCLPGMINRSQLLEEKKELEAETSVNAEITREYERVRRSIDEVERELEAHTSAISRLEGETSELDPDQRLIDHSDLINELFADANSAVKARQAETGDREKARQLRLEAAEMLAGLPQYQESESAAPVSALVRTRVDDLRGELVQAATALAGAKKGLAKQRRSLEKEEEKLADIPSPPDTTALRAVIDSVPTTLDERNRTSSKQLDDAVRELNKARRRYQRFALPDDVDERTFPSEEEVNAHRKSWDAADRSVTKLQEKAAELTADRDRDREALDHFLAADPPPSEMELERARDEREHLWTALRPRLASTAQPELAVPLPVGEFEDAVNAADLTVDRIRREAQRLADRRALETDLQQTIDRLAAAQTRLNQAMQERTAIEDAWITLWAASGIQPPAYEAARELLIAIAKLRELSDLRDTLSTTLSADQALAEDCADRLRAILNETGVAPPTAKATLSELIALATTQREAFTKQIGERDKAAALTKRLRSEVADGAEEVAQLEDALTTCEQRWQRLLAEHGLSGQPDEVSETLAALDEAARCSREADAAEKRADSAAAQVAAFSQLLAEVLAGCGRSPVSDPQKHQSTAKSLKAALDAEIKDKRELDRLTKELAAERAKQAKGAAQRQAHLDVLNALLRRACVADEQELIQASRRAVALTDLGKQLKVAENGLMREGVSLAQLEREIADLDDPDALAASIKDLDEVISRTEANRESAVERLTNAKSELDRMDGSAAAAEAADAVEQERAAITRHALDYLRLRLAEQILLRCIETYRQEHQAPVLRAAQQLFAGLTLSEYSELVATDEKNEVVLQARQADGARVGVGQMSEGTLDQLYLALRLASLQHYADQGRSMPLVLDDVLMTFDDQRTRATLQLLDGMADRFQIIVLTHHDHIGDIARHALPADRIHVHDLAARA